MSVVLRKSGDGRPRALLTLGNPGTALVQDIVTATPTVLTFADANVGFTSMAGLVAGNAISVPRDGVYTFGVRGFWEAGTGGALTLALRLNPAVGPSEAFSIPIVADQDDTNAEEIPLAAQHTRFLTAGSALSAQVTQTSGGNLEFNWEAIFKEE
jgi:hypothetical protein